MNILIQNNIWNEYAYDRFSQELEDRNYNVEFVDLIPFTTEFQTELNIKSVDLVFGSNRFVNVCRDKGFPVFKSFKPIESFYKESEWINSGAETVIWENLLNETVFNISEKVKNYPYFIKPYTEKFFTGKVIESADDLNKVQLSTSFIEDENKEFISISKYCEIKTEVRFFVVKGRIITGSIYKNKGNTFFNKVVESDECWMECQRILNENGYIDDAFVIDLGYSNNCWKIVELNNFNSSGFYNCDLAALASSLQSFK